MTKRWYWGKRHKVKAYLLFIAEIPFLIISKSFKSDYIFVIFLTVCLNQCIQIIRYALYYNFFLRSSK